MRVVSRIAAAAVVAALWGAFQPVSAEELSAEAKAQLEALKAAMEPFKDPVFAVRSGYFSTLGCVYYESGAMGVHFLNPALIGPEVDPLKPQLLVYEPDGDKLKLVAVEWLVPLATGVKERPVLFGHPFDGPMEGHEPLLPKELHHYDLHAWLFKDNPKGIFHPVNPEVACEGKHGYALLEEPPKDVPHVHQ
jgi:hypothetical protein